MARETYFKEACNLPAAFQVKRALGVPVIAVGGFRRRATIEAALQEGGFSTESRKPSPIAGASKPVCGCNIRSM